MPFRLSPQALSHDAVALAARVRDFVTGKNRYHPEKHYMRGPGPATFAKLASQSSGAAASAASES